MRFELLHINISFSDVICTLRADLLNRGLHALQLVLQNPSGRLGAAEVRFESTFLAFR
jgi:hypothetical protein